MMGQVRTQQRTGKIYSIKEKNSSQYIIKTLPFQEILSITKKHRLEVNLFTETPAYWRINGYLSCIGWRYQLLSENSYALAIAKKPREGVAARIFLYGAVTEQTVKLPLAQSLQNYLCRLCAAGCRAQLERLTAIICKRNNHPRSHA